MALASFILQSSVTFYRQPTTSALYVKRIFFGTILSKFKYVIHIMVVTKVEKILSELHPSIKQLKRTRTIKKSILIEITCDHNYQSTSILVLVVTGKKRSRESFSQAALALGTISECNI